MVQSGHGVDDRPQRAHPLVQDLLEDRTSRIEPDHVRSVEEGAWWAGEADDVRSFDDVDRVDPSAAVDHDAGELGGDAVRDEGMDAVEPHAAAVPQPSAGG